MSRSRRGLWLATQPTLMVGVLLLGLWSAARLGPVVGPLAGLAVAAVWSAWSTRVLARRAHRVAAWLRARVMAREGDADPMQPMHRPTALETNARNAPAMLGSLESLRLSFMRDPGQESRRLLAVAGAGAWLPVLTTAAVEDHGTVARAATALCAALATVATVDLYRGRQRRWARPWRGVAGPWPDAWTVADTPSKMLGPIWLALVLLGFAATVPISHADSVGDAVTLAFLLLAPVTVLWMGRHHLGWLAAIERTDGHRRLARLMVRLAPAVWVTALAAQIVLVALGLAALALTPVDDNAAYAGISILGITLMFRSMRREWQRPRQPTIVELDEVASLFDERHLERRVSAVLVTASFVSGIWAYFAAAG